MNTQVNSQPDTRPAQQRTPQGAWLPPSASVTPFACAETERENARLRLALREAHHRSGNQWQLLTALVELEQMQSPQAEGAGGNARLRAMMSAFAALNRSLDTGADVLASSRNVCVREALEDILAQLQAAAGEDALAFTVQDAWLTEQGCAALLLICAELVCNATKYGKKTTQVSFRVQDGQGILEVRDDGSGFPEGFRVEEQSRQGLQLVETLCRFDLSGEMRCHNSTQGGVVTLTFPVLPDREMAPAGKETSAFCAQEGIICPPGIS